MPETTVTSPSYTTPWDTILAATASRSPMIVQCWRSASSPPSRDGASSSALTHVAALRSELKEMLAEIEEDMMIALGDNGRLWVARLRDD
jgi:hypothetical protein